MKNKLEDVKSDMRQKILRATARVINSKGVLALTLESVAKEAKISKGGLLYHFGSKDELMQCMNDFFMQKFINNVEHVANADPCNFGKWTRAYTNNTFSQLDNEFEMNAALLAAVATSPDLVKSTAGYLKTLQDRIENDQMSPIVSTVIRLAVDGMYYNQLLGMNLGKELREQVSEYLISLTREEIR
jgi:AcrR family transcriptional regulator